MPKALWEPKTAVEKTTIQKYRGKPRLWRMEEAVRLHLEDGVSQSEAARMCGVSRSKVNVRVKDAREALERQAQRTEASLEEKRKLGTVVPDLSDTDSAPSALPNLQQFDGPILGTERRVPSFREFNDLYFNETCMNCGVHHETPDYQYEIMDLISDRTKLMKLVNIPPHHSKSTICTVKSTLYELVRDPASQTAIISRASELAKRFLYQIKQHLMDDGLYYSTARNLIEDWGPFYNPNQWSADQIYIAGRSGAQKDPSVSVYGFGTQIYGTRFTRMIFDDVADLENQNTAEKVDKMNHKIWQEYANRVGDRGELIFVGTRVAYGDIYKGLGENPDMHVLRYPCIRDEETQAMLWGDHFGYDSASRYRNSMGLERFQLVYQNVETLGANASFSHDMIQAAKDRGQGWALGAYDSSWALIAGLDPGGANDQAGFTSMVLLGLDTKTGMRHLVDLVNIKQMKAPDIMAQIYDWAERYPLRELRVEINGMQAQLFQYSTELNQRLVNRGVRIVPHHTGRNKWDAQFGVESMASMFHNGLITLPWMDVNSRAKIKTLESQLLGFPMAKPDDLVMAMWFAELGCREMAQRTALPSFDPRRKVPGRIARNRRVINFGDREMRQPSHFELTGQLEPSPQELTKLANIDSSVLLRG